MSLSPPPQPDQGIESKVIEASRLAVKDAMVKAPRSGGDEAIVSHVLMHMALGLLGTTGKSVGALETAKLSVWSSSMMHVARMQVRELQDIRGLSAIGTARDNHGQGH